MAACSRVSVLFCLLLAMALSMAAADKRNMMGGSLSEASLKEYLEDQQDEIKPPAKNSSPLQIYLHLLRFKRREQIETVEKLRSLTDYSRQYEAVSKLLDTLFPGLEESLGRVEKAGYSPDMPFPEDRELQEEVGKVYENVLMFGDFLLRMPELTKKLYSTRTEWTGIFRWAIKFCLMSTDVFSGPYATHIQLGENVRERVQNKREAMQEKMKATKGPRLRTNRHNEL